MAETSAISWTDATFNPWIGCTKVSTGPMGACEGCYAEHLMDRRLHRVAWGGVPERTMADYWARLPKWSHRHPEGLLVFGGSLCDVFDKNAPAEWRRGYFDLIRASPNCTVILLTKRGPNIVPMSLDAGGLPPNAALGVTAVTQAEWNAQVTHLIVAKAALRPRFAMVSMEPLFERVRMIGLEKLDWVITGGGTDQGPWKAPPVHPDLFRDVRDTCEAGGIPYHHKQNGEWVETPGGKLGDRFTERGWMRRVGKAAAGRLLDGRTHDARPARWSMAA